MALSQKTGYVNAVRLKTGHRRPIAPLPGTGIQQKLYGLAAPLPVLTGRGRFSFAVFSQGYVKCQTTIFGRLRRISAQYSFVTVEQIIEEAGGVLLPFNLRLQLKQGLGRGVKAGGLASVLSAGQQD